MSTPYFPSEDQLQGIERHAREGAKRAVKRRLDGLPSIIAFRREVLLGHESGTPFFVDGVWSRADLIARLALLSDHGKPRLESEDGTQNAGARSGDPLRAQRVPLTAEEILEIDRRGVSTRTGLNAATGRMETHFRFEDPALADPGVLAQMRMVFDKEFEKNLRQSGIGIPSTDDWAELSAAPQLPPITSLDVHSGPAAVRGFILSREVQSEYHARFFSRPPLFPWSSIAPEEPLFTPRVVMPDAQVAKQVFKGIEQLKLPATPSDFTAGLAVLLVTPDAYWRSTFGADIPVRSGHRLRFGIAQRILRETIGIHRWQSCSLACMGAIPDITVNGGRIMHCVLLSTVEEALAKHIESFFAISGLVPSFIATADELELLQ